MSNDMANVSNIIIYPDFEKLKEEVEKFRTEFSMLVLERDELLYHECKNIEMAYMLSIGKLEYKAYEIECAILRLKRKAELIQTRKNRQEKIILSEIEARLDLEFVEYQAKLNEHLEKMNAAIERSHGTMLTNEESRELKKLYRFIVKLLHPDLHPDLSDEKVRLFNNAVEAYERGDLNGLRIIAEIVAEPEVPDAKSDAMTALMKEKERLIKLIQRVRDDINEIKSKYPYKMKSLIQSHEKTATRKKELEEYIKHLNEVFAVYTEKIAEMLR